MFEFLIEFEGEKIPHLVKHCAHKKPTEQNSFEKPHEDDEKNRQNDDLVLRELFKKTGRRTDNEERNVEMDPQKDKNKINAKHKKILKI